MKTTYIHGGGSKNGLGGQTSQQVQALYQPYVAQVQASQMQATAAPGGKAFRQSSLSTKQHQLANVFQSNGLTNSYNQLPAIHGTPSGKQIQKADLTKEQSA